MRQRRVQQHMVLRLNSSENDACKPPESRLRAVPNCSQGRLNAKSPKGRLEAALFQGKVHFKVAPEPPESPKLFPVRLNALQSDTRAVGKVGPRRSCAGTLQVYSHVCFEGFGLCFCLAEEPFQIIVLDGTTIVTASSTH